LRYNPIEVGDVRFIRLLTDAGAGEAGLGAAPWVERDSRRIAAGAAPVVCLQIDLSALARPLRVFED
jgi:hypothetical protein